MLIADGPFAETKEQIVGYDLLDCADLDEAIEVAAKHPGRPLRRHRGEAVLAAVTPDAEAAVAEAFHEEWGRVVASLIRITGDWALAEECAQDAFADARDAGRGEGVPRRPGAWLTTVARNRALDRLRRADARRSSSQEAAVLVAGDPTRVDDDDGTTRRTTGCGYFTCCHPALPLEARVALTLRTLAGLTVAEIARASSSAEPTMAKRLVRAAQDRQRRHPYRVPPADLLPTGWPASWPCSTCSSTRVTRPRPARPDPPRASATEAYPPGAPSRS